MKKAILQEILAMLQEIKTMLQKQHGAFLFLGDDLNTRQKKSVPL